MAILDIGSTGAYPGCDLCDSIPVTTEVYCPYIDHIFPVPAGQSQNNISELPNETL